MQNRLGVPSRMITPAEARELSPLINVDDVLAAAYSPDDGHATPEAVVHGYAAGARAAGASIETGCEVRSIDVHAGRIAGVVTDRGTVETGAVVCAAGAWSAAIGEMVGVPLPVTPVRRQILHTEPIPNLPEHIPMTIDFATGFYFHREGSGLLMGMADPNETPGFKLDTTEDWIPGLLEVAERRAPAITEAGIAGGWAGLYEVLARSQRDRRGSGGASTVPVRDGILRPWVPAGPRDWRDRARPVPRSRAVRGRHAVVGGAVRRARWPAPSETWCEACGWTPQGLRRAAADGSSRSMPSTRR